MKKPTTFKASSCLIGSVLILSLCSTLVMNGLEDFADLYAVIKAQWNNFSDSLSMMQPRRTIFP